MKPGDRVLFGSTRTPGTLVCAEVDDLDGSPLMCSDETHPEGPGRLWHVRFDNGRDKPYCCERAMVREDEA